MFNLSKKEAILFLGGGLLLVIISAAITFAVVNMNAEPKAAPKAPSSPAPVFYTLRDALMVCEKESSKKFGKNLIATIVDHRRSRLDKASAASDEDDFYMVTGNIEAREETGTATYGLICKISAIDLYVLMFKTVKL